MANNITITLCLGSSCFSKGSNNLLGLIKSFLKENGLENKVQFKGSLCMGKCSDGPNILINEKLFNNVNEMNLSEILNSFF